MIFKRKNNQQPPKYAGLLLKILGLKIAKALGLSFMYLIGGALMASLAIFIQKIFNLSPTVIERGMFSLLLILFVITMYFFYRMLKEEIEE